MSISSDAASAREQSRRPDGKFGQQAHAVQDGQLASKPLSVRECDLLADQAERNAVYAIARRVESTVADLERNELIESIRRAWPEATVVLTENDGESVFVTGYETASDGKITMDDITDDLFDIDCDLRHLIHDRHAGDLYIEDRRGHGRFTIPDPKNAAQAAFSSTSFRMAQLSDDVEAIRFQADGAAMAYRFTGRVPGASGFYVRTRADDYDVAYVEDIVRHNDELTPIAWVAPEAADLLRKGVGAYGRDRKWAAWTPDGYVDDEGITFISFGHLIETWKNTDQLS